MHDCTAAEKGHIAEIQKGIKDAKKLVRIARSHLKALYKENEAAGRFEDAAEINGTKAMATAALAALDALDADAGKVAVKCYTDPGPIILGGGR